MLADFVAPYVPYYDNEFLWLFDTQLRAINADDAADLKYYSQLSLFDISITEKLESLDSF